MSQLFVKESGTPSIPDIEFLEGNSGGPVGPTGGVVNVVGDNTQGVDIVGDGGTSTLTVSGIDATDGTAMTAQKGVSSYDEDYFTVTDGFVSLISSPEASLSPYIVGSINSDYSTIQAALDQAVVDGMDAANPAIFYLKDPSFTENLTIPSGAIIRGMGVSGYPTPTIIGVHTPPTSGKIAFHSVHFQSATHVLSSGSAGTTEIWMKDCTSGITSGWLLNLRAWTGTIHVDNLDSSFGTNDGFFINDLGSSTVNIKNSYCGAGDGVDPFIRGNFNVQDSTLSPVFDFISGTVTAINTTFLRRPIMETDANGTYDRCQFSTESFVAFEMASNNTITVSNSTFSSTNANPISTVGGSGILNLHDCTFTNNYAAIPTNCNIIQTNAINPYIVGDNCSYPTIQSAITKAIIDGVSSSNPLNIYVKPGVYDVGILTIPDGISIIGMDSFNYANASTNQKTVTINGQIIVNSGVVKMINVAVVLTDIVTGGYIFILEDSCTLYLDNVFVESSITLGPFVFRFLSAGTKNLYISNCYLTQTGGAVLWIKSSDTITLNVNASNSTFKFANTQSTFSNNSSIFNGYFSNCYISNAFEFASVNSVSWEAYNCFHEAPALSNQSLVSVDNSSATITYVGGEIFPSINNPFPVGTSTTLRIMPDYYRSTTVSNLPARLFTSNFTTQLGPVFRGAIFGYSGSYEQKQQAAVQTTNATTTTLNSIPISTNQCIVVKGVFSTLESTFGTCMEGDFRAGARRDAGNIVLVGTPMVNLNSEDVDYKFSLDVDTGTQSIRQRVTGVNGRTLNWVSTFTYQIVSSEV
jgi:hypothetical protein